MTTWFTADLHLGHTNIIDFCDRPFANVTQMNETLIRNWNDRVHPDDTVYVLGDYAMGNVMATLNMTRRLMGRKIIVAGNHDRCFDGYRRRGNQWTHEQWIQSYFDHGFAEVHTNGEVYDDPVLGPLELNHFPYVGDSHDGDRYKDYRPVMTDGALLLHGHVHTAWKYRADPQPMVNVGVDVWDYSPVSSAQIGSLLDEVTPRWTAVEVADIKKEAKEWHERLSELAD